MHYHENLRKIGILIRYHRRKKHNVLTGGFTQEEFIRTTEEHPFFEVDRGQPVCSRKTLSQLENGKYIQEEALYRFFLHKLGLKYAYSMRFEETYERLFRRFDEIVCYGDLTDLEALIPPKSAVPNVIYDTYEQFYLCICRFFLEAELPRADFLVEILSLWSILPNMLKPYLRVVLLASHTLRRDVCHRDIEEVLDFTSKHPIDLWIDAAYAVSTGRILFSEKLIRRIRANHASSQTLMYMTRQLRTFLIVSQQGRPLKDLASIPPILPIFHLGNRILMSQLGNEAVKHLDFNRANIYFSSMCENPDILCLHASLFMRTTVRGCDMKNISKRTSILIHYLTLDIDKNANEKLEYLITRLLPIVEPHDRYMKTCLFRDLKDLVARTRKYKCLHECAEFLQLTHERALDQREV